jgi:hypothetical protein
MVEHIADHPNRRRTNASTSKANSATDKPISARTVASIKSCATGEAVSKQRAPLKATITARAIDAGNPIAAGGWSAVSLDRIRDLGGTMLGKNSSFIGSVLEFYERYLVPMHFEAHARITVDRLGELRSGDRLEITAGTGAVTRLLARSVVWRNQCAE